MPNEVLFWYTGYVIWATIALVIFILALFAGVCAIGKTWYYIKNWMRLQALLKGMDHNSIASAFKHACNEVGKPFNDDSGKATKWLFSMSKQYIKLNGAGDSESNAQDHGAAPNNPQLKPEADIRGSGESPC